MTLLVIPVSERKGFTGLQKHLKFVRTGSEEHYRIEHELQDDLMLSEIIQYG